MEERSTVNEQPEPRRKTFYIKSGHNTKEASNPQRYTLNNAQSIHSGRCIGQPQYNRAKTADPAHRQYQRFEITICQSPWKKVKTTQKQIKTPWSWKYQQLIGHDMSEWSKKCPVCKDGTSPKLIGAEEQNDWNLEQAVGETEKNFSTDLQLLMTETTNESNLLKTLVCMERQQHEMIPEEYQIHRRKLSSRSGLVFLENKIIVPKNPWTTVISLLYKGHPDINKITLAAQQFWLPKVAEAIHMKCETCIPARCPLRALNLIYLVWTK